MQLDELGKGEASSETQSMISEMQPSHKMSKIGEKPRGVV